MEDTEISTPSIDFHLNKSLSTMIKTEFFNQNLQNLKFNCKVMYPSIFKISLEL